MSAPSILVRRAEVDGALVDVTCVEALVTDVRPAGGRGADADVVLDAAGGALVPGLHDHHIHLFALAAARASLSAGPTEAPDPGAFDRLLRRADRSAPPSAWVRVVGYHEDHAGSLDRDRLDSLAPARPVRVQHATGAMWVLNTAALDGVGIDRLEHYGIERDPSGRATGRLYGFDSILRARVPRVPLDLQSIGSELAGYGVTSVTDLTPTTDPDGLEYLAGQVLTPGYPLHITVTGGLELPDSATPDLPRGPVKLVVREHDPPAIDTIVDAIRRAHARGRSVAIHCASRVAVVLSVAAWEQASVRPGDRVEHGSVIPAELIGRLAELQLVVVTQPTFVLDRGDRYLRHVPPDEHADLWRCGSLLRRGVGVAAGTDAPYGDPDPWRAIEAATRRTTATGQPLGPDERIDPSVALAMFQTAADDPAGPCRRIAIGAPARLCLLDRPLHDALRDPTSDLVRATITRAGILER
jgi:predicted amidohydrolase YtcJ